MNIKLSAKIVEQAFEWGVQEFCVCAGARNSPLVVLLEKAKNIKIYSFFDERSAAFFALGRIQSTGRPVAVVTTSGTAVAELLPAAVEAYYSGWPLLLITADRPKRYRKSGAPQAIEQVGIFSHYVEKSEDLDHTNLDHQFSIWSMAGPYQLNICFEEPLIDSVIPELTWKNAAVKLRSLPANPTEVSSKNIVQPLVLIGSLRLDEIPAVKKFLEETQCLFYSEALSQISENISSQQRIRGGEKVLQSAFESNLFDSVIRIGGVPTTRLWRDLEDKFLTIPVNSFCRNEFTGLARPSRLSLTIENLKYVKVQIDEVRNEKIKKLDQESIQKFNQLVSQQPLSEVSFIHKISNESQGARVYLGNSLPIREWDLADRTRSFEGVFGHRGANGIDGQVSGFLGLCSEQVQNVGLFGDLTTLYDLQSLWIANQISAKNISIIVINNSGGQIFNRLFKNDLFLNSHSLNFKSWAEMFGWDYECITDSKTQIVKSGRRIVEVVPSAVQSNEFWQKYDQK